MQAVLSLAALTSLRSLVLADCGAITSNGFAQLRSLPGSDKPSYCLRFAKQPISIRRAGNLEPGSATSLRSLVLADCGDHQRQRGCSELAVTLTKDKRSVSATAHCDAMCRRSPAWQR